MNRFLTFALCVSSIAFNSAEGMNTPGILCSETNAEAKSVSAEGLAPFFEGMSNDKVDELLDSAKNEIAAVSLMLSFGYGIEAMRCIQKERLTGTGKLFWDFINNNPKFVDTARKSVNFEVIIECLPKEAQIGAFAVALNLVYEDACKFLAFTDSGEAEAGDEILKHLCKQFSGHDNSEEGRLLFSVRQISK